MSISKLYSSTKDKKYLKVQIPTWVKDQLHLENKDAINWEIDMRIDGTGKKYKVVIISKADLQPKTPDPDTPQEPEP